MSNKIVNKFVRAFPAFRYKNYRLYFTGQLVSLIGTWLQTVALGWLVLQMTHSVFQVGLVSSLTTLPVLFFALFMGMIVDHFPKKKLLFVTQSASMIIAFLLGILTVSGTINLYEIYILAFLSGVVLSLDSPTRQSFAVEMVGKEGLTSAIAVNSATYNMARVVGPAIGGFIIAFFGEGIAFLLNSASFLAVLIALIFIQTIHIKHDVERNPVKSILEGLHYVYKKSAIKSLMIFTAVVSIFGWSYTAILPYIVKNIFNMEAESLGTFYGAMGIGAIFGTVLVLALTKINPVVFVFWGSVLSSISIILFSLTNNILIALPLLFVSGFGLLLQFSTTNSIIQHIVKDHLRGRVMGIYTVIYIGMLPLGGILIGFLAQKYDVSFALISGSTIVLLSSVFIALKRSVIFSEYIKGFSGN